MRITESQLRRMVRGVILEDLKSFIDAAKAEDLNYYSPVSNDPLFMNPKNKDAKRQARKLKNLWRQHSDQKSFRDLTFVHWFSNSVESIPEFVHASGKDEISTSISSPDGPITDTRWGVIGIQVKGWVTFAGNNMNQMMTGYMEKAKAKDRAKYADRGLPKRPIESTPRFWDSFALGAEDLHYSESMVNEAIVDNWRPVAWVITDMIWDMFESRQRRSQREELMTMIEAIEQTKLPIINTDRVRMDITDLKRVYDETDRG